MHDSKIVCDICLKVVKDISDKEDKDQYWKLSLSNYWYESNDDLVKYELHKDLCIDCTKWIYEKLRSCMPNIPMV